MPSSPAFLTVSSFIASPRHAAFSCPQPCYNHRWKRRRIQCRNFGRSAPFGLLQFNDATTLCSTGSQQSVDVPDTVNAVDSCCANVQRAKRELLQRRRRPGGLVFLRDDFFSARFPRRFFRVNTPRLSLSSRYFLLSFFPSFFLCVGCGTPTTPRLLHYRHFFLLACALRAFLLSSLRAQRFLRRRCPNFSTAGMVAAGNGFDLLGCTTTSRCCWRACTVSIDEFSHQSMS